MKVSPQNFSQLNAYLEKIENKLHKSKGKGFETLMKVDQVVSENFDVVNASDLKEVMRFFDSIKRIEAIGEKQILEGGIIRGVISLAFSWLFGKSYESRVKERGLTGLAIDALAASSGSLSLEKIQVFKEIDEFLYYESLAKYISDNKLPIASLKLSKEEMLKTAHWLTHLDLTGANNPQYFSNDFISDLLKNIPNLTTLIIKDSFFNPVIDLGLNKKNLKNLEIRNCPHFKLNFNQFQNLESLGISGSNNMNHYLNALKNLKHLKIYGSGEIVPHLNELCSLERLEIIGTFNQSIDRLTNLKHLKIEGSRTFNQSVNELKHLESLEVSECINFNQSLEGLEHLARVKISGCPALEINDLHTARILKKFNPELLLHPQTKIPFELQQQLIEDALASIEEQMEAIRHSTPDIRCDLAFLFQLNIPPASLLGYYERFPLIAELMTIYELMGSYREGKEGFHLVRSHDILTFKDAILSNLEELKGLHILSQLPLNSKIALLPLFTPDQIGEAIAEVPRESKTKWLQTPVVSQFFEGKAIDVFTVIEREIIRGTNQQSRDHLVSPLTELVTTTPFSTLAALANEAPETMLSYTFVMDEPQMASVIPAISAEVFVEYLRTQPIQSHREYLFHASTEQKRAYIDHDLLKEPELLAEWDLKISHIEDLIRTFENSKTKENYQNLESSWRETAQKTNIVLQTYQQTSQALKGILLKYSDQAFEERVAAYLSPKVQRAVEGLQRLKEVAKKNVELESQVQDIVKIPEEYVDSITGEPMGEPYHHPSTPDYILDISTWNKLEKHPTTREPIIHDELVPDSDLKTKIEALRKQHPELWGE